MAFGAAPEAIEQARKMTTAVDLEVWPDNWPTVQAWLRCQTQWRAIPGGAIGLDYVAVEMVLSRMGLLDDEPVFDGLQVMETAALRVITKD